jgi:hypothetical protein
VSGATAASSYHFLMPPLGVLFGWLILGEPAELVDIIGILPVALLIYLVARSAASKQSQTDKTCPALIQSGAESARSRCAAATFDDSRRSLDADRV